MVQLLMLLLLLLLLLMLWVRLDRMEAAGGGHQRKEGGVQVWMGLLSHKLAQLLDSGRGDSVRCRAV